MSLADLTRRIVFGRHPRRTLVRVLVLAALSFITFRWVLIPVRAEGISMEPTYRSGSLNLLNRLAYRYRQPNVGISSASSSLVRTSYTSNESLLCPESVFSSLADRCISMAHLSPRRTSGIGEIGTFQR